MQMRGSASFRIQLVSFSPWKAQRDPTVNVQQHWAPCSHFPSIRNHKGSEIEVRKRKWADNESGPWASLCIASEELAITSCDTAHVWQSHALLPFCNKPPSRATGRNPGELINGGWTQQELMLFISASNSPWAHRTLTGKLFSNWEHELPAGKNLSIETLEQSNKWTLRMKAKPHLSIAAHTCAKPRLLLEEPLLTWYQEFSKMQKQNGHLVIPPSFYPTQIHH